MHHRFCDRFECVSGGRDDSSNHSPHSSPTDVSPTHGSPHDRCCYYSSDHTPSTDDCGVDAFVLGSPRLHQL